MKTITYQDLVTELQSLSQSQWEVAFQVLRMIKTQSVFNNTKVPPKQVIAFNNGLPPSSLRSWLNITHLAGDALIDSENMYEQ